MEVAYLKSLTEEQNNELAGMAVELRVLANKLAAFRQSHGDNRGCASEAAGFATAAFQSVEELISRAQPSRRRFGR
jgi:hypothetical protein